MNDMTETAGNASRTRLPLPTGFHALVSGGPNSEVDWNTIGREGRCFVNGTDPG